MKSHMWSPSRYTVLRALLAVGSLVGMLIASGAGSHWN